MAGVSPVKRPWSRAQDGLDQIDSYVCVCLDALAAKVGWTVDVDGREQLARVLGDAYDKLLNAKWNVREALKGAASRRWAMSDVEATVGDR